MRRLSTLDWVLSTTPGAEFAVILHLSKTPPLEALRAGALSARKHYPVTGARIAGKHWTAMDTPWDGVVAVPSGEGAALEAQAFLDRPLDPHVEAPVQQLVAEDTFIVTKAHHAAADGFSLAIWLRHQFRVAADVEVPSARAATEDQIEWRGSRRRLRKRPLMNAPALWTRSHRPSASKRWLTIELLGALSTDTLADAALRAFADWNRMHGAPSTGISLWMPVNGRKRGTAGFGNGTSRVRVALREDVPVQSQIRESLRRCDWSVPENPFLMRLPLKLGNPILRCYLNRPWADMGSAVFSHITNWNGRDDVVLRDVRKIELVGQLHRRLPLAINAIARREKTWVTLTYDPARLSLDDVSLIAANFRARSAAGAVYNLGELDTGNTG